MSGLAIIEFVYMSYLNGTLRSLAAHLILSTGKQATVTISSGVIMRRKQGQCGFCVMYGARYILDASAYIIRIHVVCTVNFGIIHWLENSSNIMLTGNIIPKMAK